MPENNLEILIENPEDIMEESAVLFDPPARIIEKMRAEVLKPMTSKISEVNGLSIKSSTL